MVRPLSNDLRKRVVAAVAKGESCRSVASRFGVAVSSVVKWSQRHRATGSVAPGKMGGHRKPVLEPHRAFIRERIGQTPHLTLHALKDELAARGVKVSHNTVWLFLRREGLRFKKILLALERARSDIARRRQLRRSWQANLDPRRLVFIDETWIKTNMTPLRGWGPKGERVRSFAPHGHWKTLTFLGALLRPPHRTLPIRRPDQRRMLPRLRSAGSRSAAPARRHRHYGQPRQSQVSRAAQLH
jgi:transposase